MKIEVKKTEINDERLVCRGKLVFVKTDYVENCITGYYGTQDGNLALTSRGYMGDYFISPVIISESEEINVGDKFLWKDKVFTLLESDEGNRLNDFKNEGKKILVPFEKMVYDLLHNIASGYFKEGEDVFIECKKTLDGFDDNDNEVLRYEVLLNYVNVFKLKRKSWDDLAKIGSPEKWIEVYIHYQDLLVENDAREFVENIPKPTWDEILVDFEKHFNGLILYAKSEKAKVFKEWIINNYNAPIIKK